MPWEDKVDEWLCHPVTKVLIADLENDIQRLGKAIVDLNDPHQVRLMQGIARANYEFLDNIKNGLKQLEEQDEHDN